MKDSHRMLLVYFQGPPHVLPLEQKFIRVPLLNFGADQSEKLGRELVSSATESSKGSGKHPQSPSHE
jgi:hypothetical protein